SSTSMSTLGFIDINKAPFKVFIFSMSTLKGAFHFCCCIADYLSIADITALLRCGYRGIVGSRGIADITV
ncbi:hypothetical protein, partial [Staphylococcus aureus]|uniref:hypothetical protein n=1 Tax=Staphylococcus aureus TaxID=1280 RepID=UPI001939AE04